MKRKYCVKSEQEMIEFGVKLSDKVKGYAKKSHFTVYLKGSLGAGKTTLAKGFLKGFGYERLVKSPTYTLVEPYDLDNIKIYHFDLYRIDNPEELEYIGIHDYFSDNAISLIEWPEYGKGMLPPSDLMCEIEIFDDEREICVEM